MEYKTYMIIIWTVIGIVAFVIEMFTAEQIGFAIFGASFMAFISHLIFPSEKLFAIQIVMFFVTWPLLWYLLYKFFHNKNKGNMGFEEYIGKDYPAIVKSEDEFGYVKIGDKFFRFKNEEIQSGDQVIVESVKGVTFTVRKKGEE